MRKRGEREGKEGLMEMGKRRRMGDDENVGKERRGRNGEGERGGRGRGEKGERMEVGEEEWEMMEV